MDIMLEPTENARRDILPSSNGEISGRNGRDSEEDDVAGDMTNMVAPSAVGFTFFPPDGENIMGLSTPPPSSPRRRFDTEDSVDSNGGEVIGSLDRIERFIIEHSPKHGGTKEIV